MGMSRELEQSRAAEHIVVADLILAGFPAFLTDQGFPYDVIAETPTGMTRFQVKSTKGPRAVEKRIGKGCYTPYFMFHVRRAGKGGKRIVGLGEFDVFALVTLDERRVAYLPFVKEIKKTLVLRDRRQKYQRNAGPNIAPYFDDLTLVACLSKLSSHRRMA